MKATSILLTVVLIFALLPCRSQTSPTTGATSALRALRLINTAEAYAHQAQGRYAPMTDLLSTGALKKAADMNEDFSAAFAQFEAQKGAGILEGFEFALLVSSDGATYKLSLVERQRCGAALFTDNSGMIYAGRALGCP